MNQNDDFKAKDGLPHSHLLKSWSHMELVDGQPVSDENLPFRRGSLIRIKKSPRPDKIPDDAIAMFIDYSLATYKVIQNDLLERPAELTPAQPNNFIGEMQPILGNTLSVRSYAVQKIVQYRTRVLFGERMVEWLNSQPEKFGDNFIKISTFDE